jgi:outer membrane protein
MKYTNYLLFLTFALIVGFGTYIFLTKEKRTAFIYNQQVFDKFKGTEELKAKLSIQQKEYKASLDSLAQIIQQGRIDLQPMYESKAQQFAQHYQQVSDQYTTDLWISINEQVKKYGKEKGYAFILGASGNGSLMYAADSEDITNEVIDFLNTNYAEGK